MVQLRAVVDVFTSLLYSNVIERSTNKKQHFNMLPVILPIAFGQTRTEGHVTHADLASMAGMVPL